MGPPSGLLQGFIFLEEGGWYCLLLLLWFCVCALTTVVLIIVLCNCYSSCCFKMFFCVVIKILKRKTKILLKKKGMFILLVITIGFTFIIIFNLHRFKSFLLSLFIWPYFTKKWSRFSPFLFRSFSWCRPYSFCIFNKFFFVKGLCELCWFLLLLRERLSLLFFFCLLIVPVCTSPIIFGVSAILRFLFFSQTLCSIVETWRSVVQVPFLLIMKYFNWFFLVFLSVSLP